MKYLFSIATRLFCAVLLLASATSAQAALLDLSPAKLHVDVSSPFVLDVNVHNVTSLYSYQFDLKFNPKIFSAVSVSEGSFISGAGNFFPGTIDNATGEITFVSNSLIGPVSGVSGAGTLARVSFQSLSQSSGGRFTLQNTVLLDANGFDLAHTTGSALVTIGAVPEPEDWAMLLVGAGLVGFQVKRKTARISLN